MRPGPRVCLLCVVFLFASKPSFAGWTNDGQQIMGINKLGNGNVFIAPGVNAQWVVEEAWDYDKFTNTEGVTEEKKDDETVWRFRLESGPGAPRILGSGTEDGLPTTVTLEIPAGTPIDTEFEVIVEIGDSRQDGHVRHDDYSEYTSYTITVSHPACPTTLAASMRPERKADGTLAYPDPGKTYGMAIATMVTVDPPPPQLGTWQGVAVTETIGPRNIADPTPFKPGFLAGNPNTGFGSTFVFIEGTDPSGAKFWYFVDHHSYYADAVVLKNGFQRGEMTRNQDYKCSSQDTYEFVIGYVFQRRVVQGQLDSVYVTFTKTNR